MKKILLLSFSALLLFGIGACGEQEITPDPSIEDDDKKDDDNNNPGEKEDKDDDDKEPEPEPEKEDFTIVTKDNGLSAQKDSYVFSNAEDGDEFPPEAKIRLTTDVSWRYCSSLNEDETKIVVEDEKVIPLEAVKLDIVTNMDLVGSMGSNEIDAIDIQLDRTLIKAGDTKLKVTVKPNNGSSSINKLTTICLNVSVKEFGTIEVETYNVNLNVDLTGLAEIIERESEIVTSGSLSISDDADREDVYGYSADYNKSVNFDLENIPETVSITDFKFAVDHTYSAWIFIECEETSDRIWFSLESKRNSSDYDLEPNTSNSDSTLKVYKDNVTIEAELGDYHVL